MDLTQDERVDAEARRTIRAILSSLEADSSDPVVFNTMRKTVIRSIWNLIKLAQQSGGCEVVETYECPNGCGGVIHVTQRL